MKTKLRSYSTLHSVLHSEISHLGETLSEQSCPLNVVAHIPL